MKQPIDANATYQCRFRDFLCICHLVLRQPKIVARLPVGGYTPLQTINVEIHVMDQNGDANCEFRVKLVKVNKREDLR